MSDANPDAKAIFFEALEKSTPEELAAHLDQACGENAELRARVEDLLQAHDKAGRFLGGSGSADATEDTPQIREQPGTMIGPYKLRESIGEGGFGVVYVAEQGKPVLDGLGPLGDQDHSDREFIIKKSLVQRSQLLALLLRRCRQRLAQGQDLKPS